MTYEEFKSKDFSTISFTQELYDELVHNSSLGVRLPVVKILKERTDINQELFEKLELITKKQYSAKFMSSMATQVMFEDE